MDVRCPDNDSRLFYQLLDDGSVEVACRDCRTKARRKDPQIDLVLHRFGPAGELLQTSELSLRRSTRPTRHAPPDR